MKANDPRRHHHLSSAGPGVKKKKNSLDLILTELRLCTTTELMPRIWIKPACAESPSVCTPGSFAFQVALNLTASTALADGNATAVGCGQIFVDIIGGSTATLQTIPHHNSVRNEPLFPFTANISGLSDYRVVYDSFPPTHTPLPPLQTGAVSTV